ncbi:ABC transporter ATP-binding protein [candidate division WWE3 bacterium]|uniref:ABC transporter ATP-binding protein n=1 Tax=candidate division WWE3 bacterium TaxID=2053526 RepID=A0A955LH87_UNCKA|nr:ABC transporter ATP-binding protein [candidate division WWE3 bacterium]
MTQLRLDHVTKIYSAGTVQVAAIQDVSLDIEEEEMVAIMGPSGSGKSTLMNIIGLLDRPTTGRLQIKGEDINLSMSDRKLARLRSEKIGFVFQSFNLLSHMNSLQNVMMPTTYSDVSRGEAKDRAQELLRLVGLENRADHKPTELSGGEKQRVAIARALINNPEIILADEPTGNLDTQTGQEVLDLLHSLNEEGKTIIIITHDQFVADSCSRSVHLLDGKIVEPGEYVHSKANTEPWWQKLLKIVAASV